MSKRTLLVYPCGKKFEIRIPILIIGEGGKSFSILPGSDNYFEHAKKKFEINNLKVIEEDIPETSKQSTTFVSLSKKIRSVE